MAQQESFVEFIRRVRAGDEQAAKEVVRKYEPIVRRELRMNMTDQRIGRVVDSVDICQSIWSSFFLRTAAGQYDLDTPNHLVKLLMSMAKHKLASQARLQHRQKRDVSRTETAGEWIDSVTDQAQDTPSTIVSGKELLAVMEGKLSHEERQVADLRREGLSWADVAERLGGTPQGRRMQMDRAADRVARQIGICE
jgi:RNA polymerase sigma-70 factor (ECF subfamily)